MIQLGKEHISLDILKAFLDEQKISVRQDLLLKRMEIKGLPSQYSSGSSASILPTLLYDWLKCRGVKGIRKDLLEDYLLVIADERRFNPFLDYLKSDTWDRVSRYPELYQILGLSDARHMTYVQKWAVQTVALGLNDENQPIGAEGVLCLQGPQGAGKTSVPRVLTPFRNWFVEGAVIDLQNKDSVQNAVSGLVTELGEVDSTLKKNQAALKSFITSPVDRIRPPYGRAIVETPRRTSFIATVNPQGFLRDESGSRRYWVVPVENIDVDALYGLSREWVHQFWMETYNVYLAKPDGFRLTGQEMQTLQDANHQFDMPLPYEEEIRGLLDFDLPAEKWEWWVSSDFKNELTYFDAIKVGKALSRITSALPSYHTHPTRTIHGVRQYLLPRKHFSPKW